MRHVGCRSAGLLVLFSVVTIGCGNPSHSPSVNGPLRTASPSPPPSITTLSPTGAPSNSAPFTMQVNGNNFLPDAIVVWNGSPVSTRFVNSQQLFADLTATNLMLSGMVQVFVRTGGLNSNTVEFNLQ